MRQCEFKKRYDPKLGKYVKKHIYGEGISDVLKAVGSKIFGRTAKKAAESAAKKAAIKTSEYAGKKAGDKIVELLSNNKTTTPDRTKFVRTTKFIRTESIKCSGGK